MDLKFVGCTADPLVRVFVAKGCSTGEASRKGTRKLRKGMDLKSVTYVADPLNRPIVTGA